MTKTCSPNWFNNVERLCQTKCVTSPFPNSCGRPLLAMTTSGIMSRQPTQFTSGCSPLLYLVLLAGGEL
jgi:hypothetical protein